MKFKVMFSPSDIRVLEYDGFDDVVRFCMVQCKRFGYGSFMITYTSFNDKKKKWEYLCDYNNLRYTAIVRYAGLPLPLRFVIDNIDMDLSFLDDIKSFADTAASFDDELPF